MWQVRQKELELDDRLKRRQNDKSSSGRSHRDICDSPRSTSKRRAGSETNASAACSSGERVIQDCYSREDEGLRDEEIENFLHSRSCLCVCFCLCTHAISLLYFPNLLQ
uniref:Uncharacterized protein n=1 Tax=Davidia involucrata TaxID=16924 RepID=A0A5B7BZF9_DAVIN